jgi:tetratricopeptide (TPR) repeat protein
LLQKVPQILLDQMAYFVLCLFNKGVKIRNSLTALFLAASLFLIAFPVSSFAISKNIAVEFREKGFQAQQIGDYDTALSYYQKAVQLDPRYAAAYNDLGVMYEMRGSLDSAEQCYLRAIEWDPNYLAAYYNLASFYEKKNRPLLALYYWEKRIEKGLSGEFWTDKALENLHKLAEKSADVRTELARLEAKEMNREVEYNKKIEFAQNVGRAREHFKAGKRLLQEKEYLAAIKEYNTALSYTPKDQEIIDAREEAMKVMSSNVLNQHAQLGRKFYELGDYSSARAEYKRALSLIPENPDQAK